MILVAENDIKIREKLLVLLTRNGYEADTTAVDGQLEDLVDKIRPELVVAGISLHKESKDLRLVKSLTESPVLQGIPLFLTVDTVNPEKSGVREKDVEEIDCAGYCDKPIDTFEFIDKVRLFVNAVPAHNSKENNE